MCGMSAELDTVLNADPMALLTPEEQEAVRVEKLEQIAAEVINGSRSTVDLEYTLYKGNAKRERTIRMTVRVPDMDDEANIERLMAMMANGLPMLALTPEAQETFKARALFEVCAVAPFEDWVPLTKEPIDYKGVKAVRPDFSRFPGPRKIWLQTLYGEYEEVANRFQ